MTGTVDREFEIAEISDDYLWLEVTSGSSQGIQIAVPKNVDDDSLQRAVEQLEEGQVVKAELSSMNEKGTAWELDSISESTSRNRSAMPADD